MSDEIKVQDNIDEITITDNEDLFKVVDGNNVIDITNNNEVFEVTDEVATNVIINASDVLFSTVQSIDLDMNCTSGEQIGDAVYVFSDGEVRQANNSNIITAKVMGFVVSKSGTTNCKVRVAGTLDMFTGLTPGKQYFLDSNSGDITDAASTAIGSVLVRTGQSLRDDLFLININNNYVIRS